jgi:hypothetical protein
MRMSWCDSFGLCNWSSRDCHEMRLILKDCPFESLSSMRLWHSYNSCSESQACRTTDFAQRFSLKIWLASNLPVLMGSTSHSWGRVFTLPVIYIYNLESVIYQSRILYLQVEMIEPGLLSMTVVTKTIHLYLPT